MGSSLGPLFKGCVTSDASSATQFTPPKSRNNNELKESRKLFVTQGPYVKTNDN
jgi:CHASE1-domain containing sensor protein